MHLGDPAEPGRQLDAARHVPDAPALDVESEVVAPTLALRSGRPST